MKPVQRWDAPRGTTISKNNESGEFVMFDEHQLVVAQLESEGNDLARRVVEADRTIARVQSLVAQASIMGSLITAMALAEALNYKSETSDGQKISYAQ